MRELCTQEYESFAKISSLLTGRLRKILKNNCAPRSSIASIKSPAFIEGFGRKGDTRHERKGKELRPEKSYLRKTTRFRESKENLASFRKAGEKKRVQTAGTQRREDDGWREMVTTKLKCIINQSG